MKKLLIFVNKFDEEDDLLGFFVERVVTLAPSFEKITVITQYSGSFPDIKNVQVVSLNKSQNKSIGVRFIKYLKILWSIRGEYEGVLVIMAPSWTIVSFLITRLLGKKLYLWYAVWKGTWKLKLATHLSNYVFCSVRETYPFSASNLVILGQGINTDKFKPESAKIENSILFLGRISPVKKIEILFKALEIIKEKNATLYDSLHTKIVGGAVSDKDLGYLNNLKQISENLRVSWVGKIPHNKVLSFYQSADIFINLTPTGSFDKTILEAMSSGAIVLVSNRALEKYFDTETRSLLLFEEDNAADLAEKIIAIAELPREEKENLRLKLRNIVIDNHSINQWSKKLIKALQ